MEAVKIAFLLVLMASIIIAAHRWNPGKAPGQTT
jgi:hypothetical protein